MRRLLCSLFVVGLPGALAAATSRGAQAARAAHTITSDLARRGAVITLTSGQRR